MQKKMEQWFLRVSDYAHRLLAGLDELDWSDSIKEIQRHWIGRSEGMEIDFVVTDQKEKLTVYTTRPETIFGATFMVLAPASEWVERVTTLWRRDSVNKYLEKVASNFGKNSPGQEVTGVFTGAFAINPLSGEKLPIWVGDYVLMEYGTGAIMAVPAHDERDFVFAKRFDLHIRPVIGPLPKGKAFDRYPLSPIGESYEGRDGKMCINSDFLNGHPLETAIRMIYNKGREEGFCRKRVNYRLKDATFSRQRYWGEPFPIAYRDNRIPLPLSEKELPLRLPSLGSYTPTDLGLPPLARAKNWHSKEGRPMELSTMPSFAGSNAYSVRFMDPHNPKELCSSRANKYWKEVDVYVGGQEHATGHLIYARFWNMFLYDRGYVCQAEPFKKLINQGMIQGRSALVYRLKDPTRSNTFVSHSLKDDYEVQTIHVDISLVRNNLLDIDRFKQWQGQFKDAQFILEESNGEKVYRCGRITEKMSKSLHNVVNPDHIIAKYGSDAFRLFEMFLGPIGQS